MLLRCRLPTGETLKLRVEPSTPYEELLRLAAEGASVSADTATLSLNKASPLSPPACAVISALGLASGDLLYLASPELQGPATSAAPAAATPAALPSGGHRGLTSTARPRPAFIVSAAPSAPYVNPLTTPQPNPAAAAAAAAVARSDRARAVRQLEQMGFNAALAANALDAAGGSIDAAAAFLAEEAAQHAAEPMEVSESASPEAEAAATAAAAAVGAAAMGAAPRAAPVGAPPGARVPDSLVSSVAAVLYAVAGAGGGGAGAGGLAPHDVVILAAHALLVSGGFVPIPQGGATLLGAEAGSAAGLPPDWRSRGGMMALSYGHVRRGDAAAATASAAAAAAGSTVDTAPVASSSVVPLVELRLVAMGPTVLVHAMVAGAPASQLLSAQVDTANTLGNAASSSTVPTAEALRSLLHTLGASLLQPLLSQLRASVFDPDGAGAPTELLDLCPELRLAILAFLPPAALARAAAVCTALRALAADDALWSALYQASFHEPPPATSAASSSSHSYAGGAASGGAKGAAAAVGGRVRGLYRARLAEEARRAAEAARRGRDPVFRPPIPHFDDYQDPDDEYGFHGGYEGGGYGPGGGPGGFYPGGLPVPLPGFIGGDHDRLPGFGRPPNPMPPAPGMPPGFDPPPGFAPGHPFRPGGGRGTGYPRFDPYDPVLPDPNDPDNFGGGADPLRDPLAIPGKGGKGGKGKGFGPFGRGGGGRGRFGPPGRGWDPDGPGIDPRFL